MPKTTYEIYSPFHTELTKEEYARLEPTLGTGGPNYDDMGRLNPTLQAHADIAMDRAKAQLQGWDYPDDPTASDRYSGLDPKGSFCEADLAFAQREANLRAVLTTRPPQVQTYVKNLMDRFTSGDEYDQVYCLRRDLKEECASIQQYQRAAKVCQDPVASEHLEKYAQDRMKNAYQVKEYNKFLSALEYVAGIHDNPPSISAFKETTKLGMYDEGAYIPQEVLDLRQAPSRAPAGVTVEFANFDNQMAQRFFTSPRNWGKTPAELPADVAPQRAEALEPVITRYAAMTADRSLNPLFQQQEQLLEGAQPRPNGINRATLTIVGGKTVAELMREDYDRSKNPNKPPYEEWFQKNARRMTAEKVAAGLMAGERVETFMPDAKGRIPKEPTQITKSGYEPSPLKKVTLNAWERHFAKHGFYKKKAALAADYQRQMAARERVALQNEVAQRQAVNATVGRIKGMFFEEALPQSDMGHFRVTRSAAVSACICHMAAKGLPIEDVMDPTKLQAERFEAGRQYLQAARSNDEQWLGDTLFRGQRALLDYLDKFPHDLSKPQVLREHVSTLTVVTDALFDAVQEKDGVKLDYYRAAERYHGGKGYEMAEQQDIRSANISSYIRMLNLGTSAKLTLTSPDAVKLNQDQLRMATGALLRNDFLQKEFAKADPGSHVGDRVSQGLSTTIHTTMIYSQPVTDLVGEMAGNAPKLAGMAERIREGSFQRDYEIHTKPVDLSRNQEHTAPVRDQEGRVTGFERVKGRVEATGYVGEIAYSREKQKQMAEAAKTKANAPKAPTGPKPMGRR